MTWQLTSSDQVIKKEQDKNKVLPLLRISWHSVRVHTHFHIILWIHKSSLFRKSRKGFNPKAWIPIINNNLWLLILIKCILIDIQKHYMYILYHLYTCIHCIYKEIKTKK
jgi:hypothetical protein